MTRGSTNPMPRGQTGRENSDREHQQDSGPELSREVTMPGRHGGPRPRGSNSRALVRAERLTESREDYAHHASGSSRRHGGSRAMGGDDGYDSDDSISSISSSSSLSSLSDDSTDDEGPRIRGQSTYVGTRNSRIEAIRRRRGARASTSRGDDLDRPSHATHSLSSHRPQLSRSSCRREMRPSGRAAAYGYPTDTDSGDDLSDDSDDEYETGLRGHNARARRLEGRRAVVPYGEVSGGRNSERR